jgi:hypothetical protein
MKCKILHLPTATYMYYVEGENYLFSEFEILSDRFCLGASVKVVFRSKKDANLYIKDTINFCKVEPSHTGLIFEEGKKFSPLLKEHLEIIEVDDEI